MQYNPKSRKHVSSTTGTTSATGTAYPFGAREFVTGF